VLYQGTYEIPGNNSDANRGTAGNGGALNTAGSPGRVYIS
jgi:hypothetical protein